MAGGTQYRWLLRALEGTYAGITEEFNKERAGRTGAAEHTRIDSRPPRTRLSRGEMVPRLFDYQLELVREFRAVCGLAPPENVGLLALPTGAGKTRTAAMALLELLTEGSVSTVLWLAPTRELLQQAEATTVEMWRSYGTAVDVELVRADVLGRLADDVERGIIFATPQMVVSRLRRGMVPKTDVVVFDEAHHVEAPLFREAVARIRSEHGAALLGLSATPGRTREAETERLVDFFRGRMLRSSRLRPDPIRSLQRRGVLARLSFREIPTPGTSKLPRAETTLRALSADEDRFRALVRVIGKASQDGRVLVFTASVDHAHVVALALRREGIAARAVSSYDPEGERRAALRGFESGYLSVILNKTLLATGYDCPAVRHVVLGTAIRSTILFEQMVGRASRGPLVGGNRRSVVWQFEDHLSMHGLPKSYYRYEDYDWRDLKRDSQISRNA